MTKIDVSFNGHLPNCMCKKCCDARQLIVIIRGSKNKIKKTEKVEQ